MSCLPFCGLRLWGRKRAISSPPNVVHEDDAEHPRPYSGSTAVGTSTSADTGSEEKVNEKDNEPEKRSRSRSVSQRLVVPVGAFTSALRERARSRSRSKSLLPPTKPSEDDEKELPSLPSSNDKPPRLSLDDQEKEPRLSSSDEKPHPAKDVDEKPPRLELNLVTVTGPAWPLKDDKDAEGSNAPKQPDSAKQRVNSFGSLDTPTSPDFPDEEKKHVVERLSITKGDPNRDSKLEDENPEVETMEETEEEARKRKMRESRQRLAMEQPKDEQDRLDMFQCM